MVKKEKKDMEPVSLGVYQQMVFDRATDLLSGACNTQTVVDRLIDMSNYSIKAPTVKVIIEGGVVQDVLTDGPVELEIVNIDKDYEDYDQLLAYRQKLYEDKSLKSIEFGSANFEE